MLAHKAKREMAEENPALLFSSQTGTERHEEGGRGCELSVQFWDSFESSLHNRPSFQDNGELRPRRTKSDTPPG